MKNNKQTDGIGKYMKRLSCSINLDADDKKTKSEIIWCRIPHQHNGEGCDCYDSSKCSCDCHKK